MKTFTAFVKKRKKSTEGVRPLSDTQRPNSSGDYGVGGDKVQEERKKFKKLLKMPTQKPNDLGMVSPMKPSPDNISGNMVGDSVNQG